MRKTIVAALTAAMLVLSAVGALALVTFDATTGEGFIGRGDVIAHPELGKNALVNDPVITYGATGRYYQACEQWKRVSGTFQWVDDGEHRTGNRTVGYTTAQDFEARKAKGNGNITGYLLTDLDQEGGSAPTRVCPNNSQFRPAVTLDPDANEMIHAPVEFRPNSGGAASLTFTAGSLSGSWIWDADASEGAGAWVPDVE